MDASRRFFEAALAPLGYEISFESPELGDMQAAGRNGRPGGTGRRESESRPAAQLPGGLSRAKGLVLNAT
jgi:hypothetical protein